MPSSPILKVLVIALALAATPPGVGAAQVRGLYEGQVPVFEKDEQERGPAVAEALRQVLSKLSGVPSPGGPVVAEALAAPERFVQQFRYRDTPEAEIPLVLWVRFDASAVDALLADAGLPRWSAQRPEVLAWVEVVGVQGAEVVSPEDATGVGVAIAERAWERGLPLTFPLLDLEDRVRVPPGALWLMRPADVDAVSARYAPGAVLVGRVESTGTGTWVGRWRLSEAGALDAWETRGLTPAAAAAGGVDGMAVRLAARYAVADAGAAGAPVAVHVLGVRGLGDYARALGYLEGLDPVSDLRLAGARGERIAFSMRVRGGAESLRRIAAFGGVLVEERPPAEDGALRFRLQP
jgi:hypothetical protein